MLAASLVAAADFSVMPTRADLKPNAMSETITVVNHAPAPLRVDVRLVEWTQDAQGQDVYKETGDLVYFPRQMEVPSESRRVVRVGARSPAGVMERTYRLFIEELPPPVPAQARAQVAVSFRFGVPVFLSPAIPRAESVIGEPTLAQGKLSVVVKNTGNVHLRVNTMKVSDGASFVQETQGWYTLAGAQRTYSIDLPKDACRRARMLDLSLTIEGVAGTTDRKMPVDPMNCG